MGQNNLDRTLNPWSYGADSGITQQAPPSAVGTHPNSANGGGGSSPGIKVNPGALRAASAAAGDVLDKLNKGGRVADDSTTQAAAALSQEKFNLGQSLRKADVLWHDQVTTLVQACHKIEQSLAATAKGDKLMEDGNEMSMKEISKYFE